MADVDKKKIIVFGAGMTGEKFLWINGGEITIDGFFDNVQTGDLLGYRIEKPRYEENVFIIVALEKYFEVRKQLITMGYVEFKDFIPYQIFRKKMAIAYGNCHADYIKRYLQYSKAFSNEYGFYPFPMIQDLTWDFEYEEIISHADLFLHQAIRTDNCYGERHASVYMLEYVTDNCKVIAIPNLYGLPKCFFPQLDLTLQRQLRNRTLQGFFVDHNVKDWLKEGKSVKEISEMIAEGGIYSEAVILDMWKEFVKKLLMREQEWDIKISDYILGNYKKEKLFYDINHISSILGKEIAIRVLKVLELNPIIVTAPNGMNALETYIYPDVKKALGLEFEEKILREFTSDVACSACEMDYEEYIKQLCSFTLVNFVHYNSGGE